MSDKSTSSTRRKHKSTPTPNFPSQVVLDGTLLAKSFLTRKLAVATIDPGLGAEIPNVRIWTIPDGDQIVFDARATNVVFSPKPVVLFGIPFDEFGKLAQ